MSTPRSRKDLYRIASNGDLEVLTLHEMQSAFPDVANSALYKVLGQPPSQQVMFHNEACFDFFLIRAAELFAEGSNNVTVGGSSFNFSLFSAVQWLCKEHAAECQSVGLDVASQALADWLDHAPPFEFWCPHLNSHIKFDLPRRDLLAYAGNLSKHNLLRLNVLLNKVQRLCNRNNYPVADEDVVGVLAPFLQEIRSRLVYHATYLIEMFVRVFSALNRLVIRRFEEGNTNDVRKMRQPAGVSSDAMKGLYGSTLVFACYATDRFAEVTPVTSEFLKKRY